MSVASYFDGAEKAKMNRGQYFKDEGRFLLTLKRMFFNDGHNGKFFIAEFEVNSSNQPNDAFGKQPDPPGSTRSWTAPLTGERARYTQAEAKNLVFALTGRDPQDYREPAENPDLHAEATNIIKAAIDPEFAKKNNIDPTLLVGQQVQLETTKKTTRPKPGQTQGGTFTMHTWYPVTDEV
jgi:hypothetical protein